MSECYVHEKMKIIFKTVARQSQYDYIEDEYDIANLVAYLYDRGITADTMDTVAELQAFTKVSNEEYNIKSYPGNEWEEIENISHFKNDYKLLYSLEI